jgi:hypothetical protein
LSLIFSQFFSVIPAQAGIQAIRLIFLDSRLRGNDGGYVGEKQKTVIYQPVALSVLNVG